MVRTRDRAPWLLTGGLALALSGVSVFGPHGAARAQTVAPKAVLAGVTTVTAPAADDDGDGDELLEHWGDPKYSREERLQLGGLAVFFVGIGAAACRRRATLRRSHRHA